MIIKVANVTRIKTVFHFLVLVLVNIWIFSTLLWANDNKEGSNIYKIGEIGRNILYEKKELFYCISGICCDKLNNTYVIDSAYNKIFKFSPNRELIGAFSRGGQNDGELLGGLRLDQRLRMSIGNNNKLYIMDEGNKRLSIFSCLGEYINRQNMGNTFVLDIPAVNSRGDIYILSRNGMKLIEKYNSQFKFVTSLFEFDRHYQFPIEKPLLPKTVFRIPNDMELIKLITKCDLLVVISNYSLTAYIYSNENKLINEFSLVKNSFKADFMKKLNKLKEENNKRAVLLNSKSKRLVGSFIVPFKAFIDKDDYLALVYSTIDKKTILIKYRLDGTLYKEYILSDLPEIGFITSNNEGDIIISCENNTKIEIYRFKEIKKEV